MKGCSAFPKFQHHCNLTIRLFSVISKTLVGRGSSSSAEKQLVYSTAQANWAKKQKIGVLFLILTGCFMKQYEANVGKADSDQKHTIVSRK